MSYLKIVRFILLSFIFLCSWTDAFRINDWVLFCYIPLALGILLSTFYVFSNKVKNIKVYDGLDYLIILFLLYLICHAMVFLNSKSLNYLLAYLFVFLIEYLLLKYYVLKLLDIKSLLNINSYAIMFTCMFCILEFFGQLFFAFDIQDYIPRTRDATATFSGDYSRAYGFCTEPTILAYYLNTLGPIALWNIWQNKKTIYRVYISFFIFALAWFAAYSASAILIISLSITFSFILCRPKLGYRTVMLVVTLILFMTWQLLTNSQGIYLLFEDSLSKLSLDQSYKSVDQRLMALEYARSSILENPIFGVGLGYMSSIGSSSSMNWYLFLMMETGIIPILIIGLFFYGITNKILKYKLPAKFPFLLGFIAALGHLATISTFYLPFIFVLLIMYDSYLLDYKMKQNSAN